MSQPNEPVVSPVSRRTFLQTSAGVASVASLAMATPVHAAGDDTLKIALIGCGNRGTGAAANALQVAGPVKLWAMADAFADRLTQSQTILSAGGNLRGDSVPVSIAERVNVPAERQFVGRAHPHGRQQREQRQQDRQPGQDGPLESIRTAEAEMVEKECG